MIEKDFLRMAIDQARKSVDQGGFPAGAVLVARAERRRPLSRHTRG